MNRRTRTPSIEAVAVVVPVRNEEERLERCLSAIARAVGGLGSLGGLGGRVRAQVVLALDGCTDGSAAIAARWPFATVSLDSVGVGRARAAGVEAALAALGGAHHERVWIANTDADSQVPENWLSAQLGLANAGWDVVLGTVAPASEDLPPELRHSPLARAATAGQPVYGANLGVRASSYERVHGFSALREHEDVTLVDALRRDGAAVTVTYEAPVLTSGRLVGRSPGGYAGYLREAAARAAVTDGASPVLS